MDSHLNDESLQEGGADSASSASQSNLLRTYTGNHILSRIDPMIWKAHNPWLKLKLSVLIPLSKRAVAQLAKVPLVTPALPRLINEGVGSNA